MIFWRRIVVWGAFCGWIPLAGSITTGWPKRGLSAMECCVLVYLHGHSAVGGRAGTSDPSPLIGSTRQASHAGGGLLLAAIGLGPLALSLAE